MTDAAGLTRLLREVYDRLYDRYGPQGWWPGESPFEVIVGAILTQSTAWVNVEKALASMRDANCWSFEAIAAAPEASLAAIIRSSGYYNAKARKLQAFANHLLRRHAGELASLFAQDVTGLRSELLSIHGIGEETADDIIVYAAGKPSFVMDSYTRRIVDRMELAPQGAQADLRRLPVPFPGQPARRRRPLQRVPRPPRPITRRLICTKRDPRCDGCCLVDLCPTGRTSTAPRRN